MESKALTIIKEHEKKKDLVFVKEEDLQTQRMFVPQVTVLHATPNDFHNIKGKMMPKSHHTDRIGEAAGVSFIAENCTVEKIDKYVWVGRAQGKRRQPDGTWRTSTVQEYEFDAELRAEAESGGDEKKKKEKMLEYAKFGRQRAASGARLRVIRELVGIPTTFGQQDINRAMVVARISVNTDEMLSDPEMRKAAINHAVGENGATDKLFGPKNVTPEQIEAPQEEEADIFDDEPESETEEKPDRREELKLQLHEYLEYDETGNISLSAKSKEVIQAAIDDPDITEEQLEDKIAKIQKYFADKEGAAS